MHKDIVATPLEPFTHDEEAALYDKLDRLSVAELESYIGSAKTSLGNRALDPSWRPRIELALKRAEIVHIREEAAAAVLAAAPPPAVVVPPVKAKRASKAKAAKTEVAGKADEAEDGDAAAKGEEAEETDEAE
ncbi:MAG: hypothetical protein ACXWJ3_18575 [Caldimonas sp.]